MPRIAATLLLVLLAAAAEAAPSECETYWLYYGGKEEPQYLRIEGSWPLEHFERTRPWWYYGANDQGLAPESQRSKLQWRPVSGPAELKDMGKVGGLRVYEITYSPLDPRRPSSRST